MFFFKAIIDTDRYRYYNNEQQRITAYKARTIPRFTITVAIFLLRHDHRKADPFPVVSIRSKGMLTPAERSCDDHRLFESGQGTGTPDLNS